MLAGIEMNQTIKVVIKCNQHFNSKKLDALMPQENGLSQ